MSAFIVSRPRDRQPIKIYSYISKSGEIVFFNKYSLSIRSIDSISIPTKSICEGIISKYFKLVFFIQSFTSQSFSIKLYIVWFQNLF